MTRDTSVPTVTPGCRAATADRIENASSDGDAMKAAQAKNKKLPLVIVNHTYNDYMGGRASLTRTGAKGTKDLPIPGNVRMYDIAGAPHTNARDKNKDCDEGQGQVDWSPAMRAQLAALDEWIRGKAQPPANKLMSLEARPADPDLFQAPKYLAGAK